MYPQQKIAYYYDDEIGLYKYADGHPMKPHRTAMTHALITSYGLLPKLQPYDSSFIQVDEDMLTQFHADEYIEFIKSVSVDKKNALNDSLIRCKSFLPAKLTAV
jgi:histone deacetylase 1/2